MIITKFNSPNFNERAGGQKPKLIILHYTGTLTDIEAHEIYLTPNTVSPHYMINKQGDITQYVDETMRAWHAGKSYWQGDTDINSSSIGIEIVNSGHEHNLEEFPAVQIENLIELLHAIKNSWGIEDKNILGHSDIAVGRKIDPGERFPWDILCDAGIGLLPKPNAPPTQKSVEQLLHPVETIVKEFRRRYLRHTDLNAPADDEVHAALSSLLHQTR